MSRKNSRKGFSVVTFTENETPWMQLARCAYTDPEEFFPENIENKRMRRTVPHALEQLCGQCRVKDQCLEFAMEHDLIGIWGGTTDYTRDQLKKQTNKTMCPGCSGYEIIQEFDGSNICSSCGLSWSL